jgi:hypothetical protein
MMKKKLRLDDTIVTPLLFFRHWFGFYHFLTLLTFTDELFIQLKKKTSKNK